MKHSKANTITPPVFVKNTDLHKARIKTLDESRLAFVRGGGRYLPTSGVKVTSYSWTEEVIDALYRTLGLSTVADPWCFYPVSFLTNVLINAGLITTTALITKKITKSDKNNPKQTKK